MYSVTITHTRSNKEVLFFWETDLADHDTYQMRIESYYNNNIVMGERVYSEDRLTVTSLYTADSNDIYYDCKRIADSDPELIWYWLERDNYNFDNNIFRVIEG